MKLLPFYLLIIAALPVLGQSADTVTISRPDTGILLNSVTITGRSGSTRFRELKQLQVEVNKKNGIYYHGRPPIVLLNPFGGKPITFFYELLSRGGKRARRMQRNLEIEFRQSQIDQVFNASFVTSLVPLSGDELESFLWFYRPDYETASKWTSYDRDTYIRSSYIDFRNLDSIPPIPRLLKPN